MANLCAADGFHDGFLKGGADGHNFAGGFHLCAKSPLGVDEFVKRPFREFDDHIVQSRLEAGAGLAGDGVFNFTERIADGNLCGDLGNRVAGGF